MCRGRRDAVVGLALVLLRASAKGLFDEITPAKPRVRSELVLPPPPPPPPALAVAAPLRPVPPSPWPGRGAVVMERGRPAHAKACCLSALLFGALRFAAAAPAESVERLRRFLFPSGAAGGGLAWIRGLVVVVAAVLYAAEAARSSTLRYVSDARGADAVDAFLRGAVDAAPVVSWTAESYHYETTSRGSGDARRASTRRVVTAVARETWAYGAWRDASGGVDALARAWRRACSVTPSARRALVKIRLRRSLAFDDAATADEYAAALADFARRHRRRDVHLSLEQDFDFKGWDEDERILGIRRPLGAPGALWSPAGFWAAAGLGLTVPYRLAFERKCAVASLDVAKRVRSAPHVAREADPVI